MYSLPKPLMLRDSHQQSRELLSFVLRQRGQQGILVFSHQTANGVQDRFPLCREAKRITAAIGFIGLALNQALRFQFI